jgi:poly-gamma-glutamate synthesis protein (capsule biosynthesis protein)
MGDVALTAPLGLTAQAVFGDLHAVMAQADLRTANLEATLTERNQRAGSFGFIRAAPRSAELLRSACFDVLNVANNHVLDLGHEALEDTLDRLDKESIAACGVGSGAARENLAVRFVSELRVGFVGFCDDHRAGLPDTGGPQPAEAAADTIAATIAAARTRVDFLVCHVHWGYEFSLHPLLRHQQLARAMIGFGADLVLCHHAHVPAGIEILGHGAIAYGLGNAVMPMSDYMRSGHPWTCRSFMLEAAFAEHAVRSLRLHPFGIASDGRIRALAPAERHDVLAGVGRLSARLQDAAFLKRIERCRLVYEAHGLLQSLERAAHAGASVLQERLMSLRILRQRQLLEYLGSLPQFAGAAAALVELACLATDAETVVRRYAPLRSTFAAALPALRAAYRWQDALRARIL